MTDKYPIDEEAFRVLEERYKNDPVGFIEEMIFLRDKNGEVKLLKLTEAQKRITRAMERIANRIAKGEVMSEEGEVDDG